MFRRPTILQLCIESFRMSTINALHRLLHGARHLSSILLQKAFCTKGDKLVILSLVQVGSILSRKDNGLNCRVCSSATEQVLCRTVYLSAFETEWLCVDLNKFKIVNVFKPPTTRLQKYFTLKGFCISDSSVSTRMNFTCLSTVLWTAGV